MVLKWTLKLKIENELYSRFKQYFNNTLVLVAADSHGKLIKALIINSKITVILRGRARYELI